MFNWLVKIVYRKKVKRLENLSKALEYLGTGQLRSVHSILNSLKPSEFLEDLALYYFVKGRLALEEMEVEKSEIYLLTAWSLGFRRTPIYISLGLAKARLRKLGEAKELLTIASERSDLDEQSEIISALLNLIQKISEGYASKQISEAVKTASNKILHQSNWKKLKEKEWKQLLEQLFSFENVADFPKLSDNTNNFTTQDFTIAVLGSYLVKKYNGTWEYGLEMEDHAVIIEGISYRPIHFISSFKAGKINIEDIGNSLKFNVLSNVFLEEEGLILNN